MKSIKKLSLLTIILFSSFCFSDAEETLVDWKERAKNSYSIRARNWDGSEILIKIKSFGQVGGCFTYLSNAIDEHTMYWGQISMILDDKDKTYMEQAQAE